MSTPASSSTQAPPLPHWESTPEDLEAATREIKAAIRARIEASGPHGRGGLGRRRGADHRAGGRDRGRQAARRDDLAGHRLRRHRGRHGLRRRRSSTCTAAAASSSAATSSATRRSPGTRASSTTSRATTSSTTTRGPADDFFGSVGSRPEIYPVYWSTAQMEARQSDRMARVQSFLNRQWTYESDGVQWFDPDQDSLYPDRIRRRPPGANSDGLGAHLDPGTLDLWMTQRLPAGLPPPVRRLRRAVRPVGRLAPHRRPAVPRHDHDARCSAPSRAGPRCRTWPATRACCTPCRSPRRWPT